MYCVISLSGLLVLWGETKTNCIQFVSTPYFMYSGRHDYCFCSHFPFFRQIVDLDYSCQSCFEHSTPLDCCKIQKEESEDMKNSMVIYRGE